MRMTGPAMLHVQNGRRNLRSGHTVSRIGMIGTSLVMTQPGMRVTVDCTRLEEL